MPYKKKKKVLWCAVLVGNLLADTISIKQEKLMGKNYNLKVLEDFEVSFGLKFKFSHDVKCIFLRSEFLEIGTQKIKMFFSFIMSDRIGYNEIFLKYFSI